MPAHKYKTNKGTMWYAKINYIDPVTKKSTQKVKRGFKTKSSADQYERNFKVELDNIKFNPAITPKALFADVYAVYQRHIVCKELREDSIETKNSIINHYILPFFKEYAIGEIDELVITEWKNYVRSCKTKKGNPLSETYQHTIQSQLNGILNFAVKRGYIQYTPMLGLPNLGCKNAEEYEIWTVDEFDRFADEAMKRPRTYYLYLIYFWCGLRRSEGLCLNLSDIVFEDDGFCYLKVTKSLTQKQRDGKTKSGSSVRRLYLPQFLADELQEYIDTLYDPKPTDKLFPVSRHTMYNDFEVACKTAGVKKIRIHDLRHSYASILINSKRYSSTDIAHQLGHSSSNITMRTYAHMLEPTKLSIAQTLDEIKKGR